MKIVFFGTPEFAVPSLDRLVKDGHNIAAVVTMPDKIAGRGHKLIQSDVKKYALENNIPILQPEKLRDEEFLNTLKAINADLFVVIAFRMLPEAVWNMPPLGTFNLHASLLPKYRGAAPINRAIMNGESQTGVTTFFLTHTIDTGDIIDQKPISIDDNDNAGSVHDKLMMIGADMVSKTVAELEIGNVRTIPQPEGEFIPAPKIFKEDCLINWNSDSHDIHNQIRGLSPYPAAYSPMTDDKGKSIDVKIFESSLVKDSSGNNDSRSIPGEVLVKGKQMWVSTKDGWLEIKSLQPAGKKRMPIESFLLGYHPVKFG